MWCIRGSSESGNSGFPHADMMAKLFADVEIQHQEQSMVGIVTGKTRKICGR